MNNLQNVLSIIKPIKVPPDGTAATTWSLAAGITDVFSGAVDLRTHQAQGLDWIVDAGAIAASGAITITAQHSSDGVTYTDIQGSQQTMADTDDDFRIGLSMTRCMLPFQRLKIVRGDAGNSSITLVQAFPHGFRALPVTQAVTAGQFLRQPEIFDADTTGTA